MSKKLVLVGCKRYNHKGELFVADEVYIVDDDRAKYLLDQTDISTGFPYFEEYSGPETGRLPNNPPEEYIDHKAARRERPKTNQRDRARQAQRPERKSLHPQSGATSASDIVEV